LGKYRMLLRPSANTLSIAPAITPLQNQGVIGTRVTFSTSAQGSDLSYRWEVRTMSNSQWSPIAGEVGPSLSVDVERSSMVCPRYRAGITTATGETFYTHDAVLVDQLPPPVITQDLPETVEVAEGDRLTLSLLTTTGSGFTYWYVNNGPRQGGSGVFTTQPLTLADDGMTVRAEAVAYAGNHQCTAHGIAPSKVTTVRVVQR
jgi:hypothetical protein